MAAPPASATTRTRPAAPAGAQRLTDLPPELVSRILAHFDDVGDLVAANAASRLFRGAPLEHALRERARARGHSHALPTTLPAGARTWTEELLARERVHELACGHGQVVVAVGTDDHPFSAFVDADGGVHTCGEPPGQVELSRRERSALAWRVFAAMRHAACSPHPTRVTSLSAVRVRSVAAGYDHLLVLSEAGAVYSCGENEYGQLGLGHRAEDAHVFVPLPALDAELVVAIAAAGLHSLALTAAGCAYSWGYNRDGQLGHGDRKHRWEPTRIEALDGVRVGGVATGDGHTLLLSAQGAVYSCGWGYKGRLGHGDEQEQHTPRRIEALAGVRAVHVSAGEAHSLVVDAEGGVCSFGFGRNGELGHGDDLDQEMPTPIEALAGVRAVRACAGHCSSAVLGADGSVHTFGDNSTGQLGRTSSHPVVNAQPARLHALSHACVLGCSLSNSHALYATADGGAYACGRKVAALGLGVNDLVDPQAKQRTPQRVAQLPPLAGTLR